MQKFALIVAGGSGTRMQHQLPKQFIPVAGLPILMHTLQKFHLLADEIILVLSESAFETWYLLQRQYHFDIPHTLVAGGDTRIASVKNGLENIHYENSLVAIHDGVRPFVTSEIIQKSYETAQQKGSAITAIPLKDSIREIKKSGSVALDRSCFRLIQTPQTFQTALIKKAYQLPDIEHLTDDASVAEQAGFPIELIEGSFQNIKITTPEDLWISEAFLKNKI